MACILHTQSLLLLRVRGEREGGREEGAHVNASSAALSTAKIHTAVFSNQHTLVHSSHLNCHETSTQLAPKYARSLDMYCPIHTLHPCPNPNSNLIFPNPQSLLFYATRTRNQKRRNRTTWYSYASSQFKLHNIIYLQTVITKTAVIQRIRAGRGGKTENLF